MLDRTRAKQRLQAGREEPKKFSNLSLYIEQREELIDLMVWWVLLYLVPSLDELDGVEILGADVPDQLGHSEVPGPDVPDHLVPLHPPGPFS
jgi:hypothetical protein